ncbi:transmembrane protease serine 11F [Caerostris extrusa]|uniref:limulus clotting factor C n=1 Tax=Caerostris extrusa TaxID=172846 RepID=A0AAV4UEA4_CAEEX|nr:transmembrane protease serine 11F [Caerostris extrusa]
MCCFRLRPLFLLQTTRRISHGKRTVVGEWPWTVAIALNRNNYSTIICGGALLDRRTIITAAHCFERDDAQYYTVYFGKYHRRDRLDDRLVKFSLTSRIVSHPEFDGITFNNDIALVKFAPSVQYSVRIQPICLPTPRSSARNLVPPQRGYVTGWGINENGVVSEELLMAHLPVQTDQTCTEAYRRQGLNLTIRPGMFCAGFPQGVISACTGDSGSPLVFYNNNTDRHILEGLVSYAVNGNCGLPDRYTVFTRVAYYMPWILRNWPR